MRSEPLLDHLKTRRSPKASTLIGPGPTDAELGEMLTIAARVPDHGKLTPWRFIVIRGDRRAALGEFVGRCFDADNSAADELAKAEWRKRFVAPVVIAVVFRAKVHPKVPEWEQVLSAGAACMNLLHAAKAVGFGGTWLSEWYSYDRRVLGELGVTAEEKLAGFVHVGREIAPREDRPRPVLTEIVTEY